MKRIFYIAVLTAVVGAILSACSTGVGPTSGNGAGKLKVVATTTIVADVVRQVGGDLVDVQNLLPFGADPHAFDPRPQDIAAVGDADLVFANGAGLEEFLQPLLDSAGAADKTYEVSERIQLLAMAPGSEHANGDPHTWTDPKNVMIWTENIAKTLSLTDEANAAVYAANAEAYIAQLRDLDTWIRGEVAQIPPDRRKLVTDHEVFGYFANEYGFALVGALIGSFSSNASSSAQELAALEDAIRAQNVPAVFVGTSTNPRLAEQIAGDTGVRIVPVYTGSLSAPGGEADSYLKFMRYNVSAIVDALK